MVFPVFRGLSGNSGLFGKYRDRGGSGMKPKFRARAAELNAEPELFQFKANITNLIKSKAQKYHTLRNQHKI